MRGAGLRQPLPPRLLRPDGQAPVERGIRRRGVADFLQGPQRVLPARGLDDPRQHELPEYLVVPCGLREPERVIGSARGVPQVAHPRGGDLQRARRTRHAQAQVEFQLPGRELPDRGPQRLELGVVVRRADVLDLPRPPLVEPHDLDRGRPAARWLHWRRRHQARSRWFHKRARLARNYALVS